MSKNGQTLVSVPVIAYNSAKTVIETLESIKAQTYPNIELIISDDCSTDNTVELCRDWIEQNNERFVRTEVITVENNTGVSGNQNRAEAACQGEWVKPIAGDDLLMPNCIQDCMNYVKGHPETIVLFGRVRSFGGSMQENQNMDANFDYHYISLPKDQLLHLLLFCGDCISAPGFFFHRSVRDNYHIVNDERIPHMEDWPKWVNMLQAGISFHFLNKDIVMYRLGTGISTGKRMSLRFYESERLMRFYYLYPAWQQEDPDAAVKRIVQEECEIYKHLLEAENEDASEIHQQRDEYRKLYEQFYREYNRISSSKAYRLGKFLLKPFSRLKSILNMNE